MIEPDAKEQVRKLLATLQSSATNDPELRALLTALDADIHRALMGVRNHTTETASLAAHARGIATRFAVKHPRLEPVLEELVNLVASIGV